ncbi:metallophosphoesterase [Echinicola marina]|uniref:metallophosphoesterase n=1 Tax=Echinicola marina TaxID=2859768 RepID=UPI001CF6261B|nr:metallophosphoesterase [Echinicola marina]UCS94596.1 metallophosphoesterase [Echinicola marina]
MKQAHYYIDRRKFLKLSSAFTGGMFLSSFNLIGKGKTIRVGLVTDSHYADAEAKGTRYYRESLDKMREFVEVMNDEKVDFVMHLGDFKDQDVNQREEDTLKFLQDIESVYAQFKGPRYHCLGNHDVDSIRKEQFLSNTENTGIAKDKSYYSFDQKGMHFIVLDANYHEDGRDHFYKDGVDWTNTNIPETELEWLKADLESNSLPTVVFCHHPLFEYFHGKSQMHVNNYERVKAILEESGKVMAVFQGHVHEERFECQKGIHYVTQLAMVDGSGLKNSSFSILEIDKKGINLLGFKKASGHKMKRAKHSKN